MKRIALMAALVLFPFAARAQSTTVPDSTNYAKSPFLGYLSPFGKYSNPVVEGRDFSQSMQVVPSTFPNATTMTWHWPSHWSCCGVWAFNAISFGTYYPGSAATAGFIAPKRLSQISGLSLRYNFSYGGDPTDYDVITDIFLTANANQASTKVYEIEIFFHTPPASASYIASVTQLFHFTVYNRDWTVAINRNAKPYDIFIMPTDQKDIGGNYLDLADIFDRLVTNGVVVGDPYFNGLGFGAEPFENDGSLTINSFAAGYW